MTAPAETGSLADEVGDLWRRVVLAEELHTAEGRRILGTALAVAYVVLYSNGCWSPELRALERAGLLTPPEVTQ